MTPRLPSTLSSEAADKLRAFLWSTASSLEAANLKPLLIKLVFVRVLLLSIFMAVSTSEFSLVKYRGFEKQQLFWAIGLIYAISLANVIWLHFSPEKFFAKRVFFFGYLQLGIDILLSTLLIYASASSTYVPLYIIIIIAAASMFSSHGAIITAAFSGLCYSIVVFGFDPESHGNLPLSTAADILVAYITLLIIALASSSLAKKLEHTGSLASSQARDLEDLSQRHRQLFDDVSEGIITLDLNSTVTGINQAARAIIGLEELDPRKLEGQSISSILNANQISGFDELDRPLLNNDSPRDIALIQKKNDQEIYLNCTLRNFTNTRGDKIGNIVFLDDVSHIKNIEERLSLHERMAELLAETEGATDFREIEMIGESPIMRQVFNLVQKVAASDSSVLIGGESGTGKELIARAVHSYSNRSAGPFVPINCGAIPESLIESELFGHKKGSFTGAIADAKGLFRQAEGGTIFLDEIAELPLQMQSKLLRVLQERKVKPVGGQEDIPVNLRVIAATNKELKREVAAGRFREDLYYRLNVIHILLPPLREREEDIPFLVRHFFKKICQEKGKTPPQISPEALQLLLRYPFPGNVRELENIIERAMVLGGNAILPEHLPLEISRTAVQSQEDCKVLEVGDLRELPIDLEVELSSIEKKYLNAAMKLSQGKKSRAAELLGLNFRSLRYRLKKYGLEEDARGD